MSQLAESESETFCIRQIRELNKSQKSIGLGQHFHGNHQSKHSTDDDAAAVGALFWTHGFRVSCTTSN